jgi:hypothetical protein
MSDVRLCAPRLCALALSLLSGFACSSPTPTGPSPEDGFSIGIENEPCIAPAAGSISCQFTVLPATRRDDGRYRYGWRIENPANGRASQGGGAWNSSLPLQCEFSSGVARFEVLVKLSVYDYGLAKTGIVTRSALITRTPGACGT